MTPTLRLLLGLALVAGALSNAGCAALRVTALRQEGTARHVYSRPIEQVWPEAVQALVAEGYSYRSANGHTLVTDPREDSPGSGTFSTLLLQGQATGPQHCVLRAFKKTERASSLGGSQFQAPSGSIGEEGEVDGPGRLRAEPSRTSSADTAGFTRDLELEWRLIHAVEPQQASYISAEAERAVKEGKAVASAVPSTQAGMASGPTSFEGQLEIERAKKRLPPAVWIPAASGLLLAGGGIASLFEARRHEVLLIQGDRSIQTDADIRRVVQTGKTYEALGLTLCGVGVVSLGTAIVLRYYTSIGRSPVPAVSVVPGNGGAMAVVGGSF